MNLPDMKELARWAEEMESVMRTGRLLQLLEDGGALVVRPVTFFQPGKHAVDPVFGLSGHHWVQLRKEGFSGWQLLHPGSFKSPVIIHTAAAEKWLEARRAAQAAERPEGGIGPAGAVLKARWEKRRENAAAAVAA